MSSRGDYKDIAPNTYLIDTQTDEVRKDLGIPCSQMTLTGDSLFLFNYDYGQHNISSAIYDVTLNRTVSTDWLETAALNIEVPYGIAINPESKEVFVTDAKDYVTPGKLFAFDKEGHYQWAVTTGDIPAHFAFTTKKLKPINH